ncbi:MAG: phosphodiester glycosidase family protein [Proteobacteria bacterium]|nr:phosphodiester glycosidase family protein [Pseudomonadota bacterium]
MRSIINEKHFLRSVTSLFVVAAGMFLTTQAHAQNWEKIYDGVDFVKNFDGVHAVRVETDLIGVSIIPYVMDKSYQGKGATPMAWGKDKGLQVTVNTNFYNMNTITPNSIAVSDGDVWHDGNNDKYAQIGFTKDGVLKWVRMSSSENAQPWMYNVVSGMGELLVDGQIPSDVLTSSACKSLGHCSNYRSRTGFGVSQDGKYIYWVVSKGDGQSGGGVKLDRFAEQMRNVGSYFAINLDGGGSSGLYIESHNKMYGTNTGRKVALNMGFKILPKPDYVCKVADVDNPGSMIFDMASDHWGLAAAESLFNHNVTEGCGSDPNHKMFCPNCGMQRKAAAIFVARSLGLEKVTPASPSFGDVTAESVGEEAAGYIEALLQKGIVSKADAFRPNDIVTRAEAAAMIAAGYISNIESYQLAQNATFTDVAKEHWGFPYIEALVRNCIVQGTDGQYHPDDAMNRVEFASILARAAQYIPREGCIFTKQCEENGKTECNGNDVVSCIANELVTTSCASDEICAEGACHKDIPCDASFVPVCDGQTLKTCVSDKVAFEVCPQACENGQCVECLSADKPKCENGIESVCLDKKLVSTACQAGEVCGASGVCLAESGCSQGDYKCVGNSLYTCNGSDWYEAYACAEQGLICANGACVKPQECTPGQSECVGDKIRTCDTKGYWGDAQSCGDKQSCLNNQCEDVSPGDNPPGETEPPSGGENTPSDPGDNIPGGSSQADTMIASSSSCSTGHRNPPAIPMIVFLLTGIGAVLRRRRMQ